MQHWFPGWEHKQRDESIGFWGGGPLMKIGGRIRSFILLQRRAYTTQRVLLTISVLGQDEEVTAIELCDTEYECRAVYFGRLKIPMRHLPCLHLFLYFSA